MCDEEWLWKRVWILVAGARCAEAPSAHRSQICPVVGSSEEEVLVALIWGYLLLPTLNYLKMISESVKHPD